MNFKTFLESYNDSPVDFKNMMSGDFPPHASAKFLSKALGYIKDAKYEIAVSKGHDWSASDPASRLNTVPSIEIEWSLPSNFFVYYKLLRKEDKEQIGDALLPLFKKIDKDFVNKTKDVDWSKRFEIRTFGSLSVAVKLGLDLGKIKFISTVNKAAANRYHKMNDYDAVKAINKLSGQEQRDAINKLAKDSAHALSQIIGPGRTP